MIYRIKQISENEFIPKCGGLLDWIFNSMEGIEKNSTYTWISFDIQKKDCVVNFLEEAREIIKDYKILINTNGFPKGFPKYHKL
jgi:hypothetical protein